MKKPLLAAVVTIGALFGSVASADPAITFQTEKAAHPQIVTAINDMNVALKHLKDAAHDFGGHKADAMEDTRKARKQLIWALFFRLKVDEGKLAAACGKELKGDAICEEISDLRLAVRVRWRHGDSSSGLTCRDHRDDGLPAAARLQTASVRAAAGAPGVGSRSA